MYGSECSWRSLLGLYCRKRLSRKHSVQRDLRNVRSALRQRQRLSLRKVLFKRLLRSETLFYRCRLLRRKCLQIFYRRKRRNVPETCMPRNSMLRYESRRDLPEFKRSLHKRRMYFKLLAQSVQRYQQNKMRNKTRCSDLRLR